jgi:hypothetical protein
LFLHRQSCAKLTSPLSRDAIGKEGRIASSLQAFSVAFQDHSRLQPQGKEAQASQVRSDGDGEPRGDPPQRSASPIEPLGVATKIRGSNFESSGIVRTHQVPSKGDFSHPPQPFSLHLPVSEEVRRTRRPSLPGKRKGSTSPPPG